MAGKGRPRKPAAILKLTGAPRAGKRAEAEVKMAPGDLEMPKAMLDSGARVWWGKMTRRLTATDGLITADNAVALAALCQSLSTYEQANAIIQREGIVIETTKGETKRHPALVVREKAFTEIRMGCAQFGMTPADRSGITTTGSKGVTPGGQFLKA